MPLNKPFQHQPSVLASYDWTDIVNGLGYSRFYLIKQAGGTYKLNDNASFSNIGQVANNAVYTFNSSVFNGPRTIRGTAFLEVAEVILAKSPVAALSVVGVLKLVSGTTKTLCTFPTMNQTGATATNNYYLNISSADISIINVKQGDYLQLEITLGGSDGYGQMHIDPAMLNALALGTTKLSVPFRIDL